MINHYIFVYGSLKKGFGNNRILARHDATFLGEFVTKSSDYNMISLGSFPGAFKVTESGTNISGELYSVNSECFKALDMLESNGSFYQRVRIRLAGFKKPVWMYMLLNSAHYERLYGSNPRHIGNSVFVLNDGNVLSWHRK